jgi:hypothetical protein
MDLNAPEKINEKAIQLLQKRYDKIEPKFVKSVVSWIEKFRTTNGNLVRGKDSLKRLSSFKKTIERYLLQAGYNDMISGFLESFDELGTEQQSIHKELNGVKITKSFLNTYKRWAVNNVIASMQGQGLNQALINPLKNELLIAINQGSSITDVVKSIAGQLTTTEARQGVLKRISLQTSRDAVLQYDGVVNEAIRKVYKMDAVLYVGSIVKDSRPQCQRWVTETKNGKLGLILFEDLQQEIDWADDNGTGMIANTTPENFCQNRGGYNCRHIAYPVRSANYIKEEKPNEVPKVELGFDKKYDNFVNNDEISDDAKGLINKLPKPNNIFESKKYSYYDANFNIIGMQKDANKNVFMHEYGHHIDNVKKLSLKSEFTKAYDDDLLHLKELFKGKNIFDELKKEWKGKSEYYGASDILDAMSGGVFYEKYSMYGHGKKYYKSINLRHKENFANIFQAWSLKDKAAVQNIKKYYPNLYKEFLNIVKTL